jgi:hypothetical protein
LIAGSRAKRKGAPGCGTKFVVQTFTLLSVEVCFQQEYLRPTVYLQEIAKFLE